MRVLGFGRALHSSDAKGGMLRSDPPDCFSDELRIAEGILVGLIISTAFWMLLGFLLYQYVQ